MARVGYRFPSVPAEVRFWRYTDRRGPAECWPWLAARSPKGYGRFSLDGQRVVQAHRFAYELLIGPIPEGMQLDHLCRDRGCVNPAHLEPVTNRENVLRGLGPTADNARKRQCVRGHPLDGVRGGQRDCLTCRRETNRAYRRRHGAEVNARRRERRALTAKLRDSRR